MERREQSVATVVVNCNSIFDYLSKYKYNSLVASASKGADVEIDNPNCAPRTIKISGPAEKVRETRRKVDDVVHAVKSSWFVVDFGANPQYLYAAVESVTCQNECIVNIRHISSVDLSSIEMTRLLKCQEMEAPTVTVLVKELQLQKADVLVSTTNKQLTLGTGLGGVSTALLKVCGPGIQEELKLGYPDGIEHGWVAETGPGELTTCMAIYHGTLPSRKGLGAVSMDKCYIALVSFVYRCLIKASSEGYKSIAFPSLGTGELEYPYISVVKLMYKAVNQFLQENPGTSLQDIYFIVYPGVSLDMKQCFLVHSVTQKVPSVQIDNTASLHEKLRASHTDIFEIIFRVGKTMVKVVNADVTDTSISSIPIVVLWTSREIKDPSLNNSVRCLENGASNNEKFQPVVANLKTSKAVSDTTSIKSKTLLHCYCAGDKDDDVTAAIQCGLEQVQKHCCQIVTIPVTGKISEKPMCTAKAVLLAIKKYSSRVHAVVIVVPDGRVFQPFVSMATDLYKPFETSYLDTKAIVEKTWIESFAEWSSYKVAETLKKGNNSVLTVTSDSEETNKRVAMAIQNDITRQSSDLGNIN